MVDVSIGNETSPEANWNRQTGRQTGRRTDKPVYWEAAPPKMTDTSYFMHSYEIMVNPNLLV